VSLRTLFRLGLAALAIQAALPAAEEEYTPISLPKVRAGEFRPGEKVSITGKYKELINRELRLSDVEVRFIIKREQNARQLFDLKPERDNITLLGSFSAPKETGEGPESVPVFEVEAIKSAPSDAEFFEEKLKTILSDPNSQKEKLWQLAREITQCLKRFEDAALKPIARRALGEAFAVSQGTLEPNDADGRLALIREIHTLLGDAELTVEFLKTQARKFPSHAPTSGLLSELGCRRVRGEWLSYQEFKRKLGFVIRGDRWVKPSRKEFLDLVQELTSDKEGFANQILRFRTEREYLLLAQSGKVEKGMTRQELAEALGLPDHVERLSAEKLEVDQWSYGERRVYLLNGQVVATPP
jgi:hypothetical protein